MQMRNLWGMLAAAALLMGVHAGAQAQSAEPVAGMRVNDSIKMSLGRIYSDATHRRLVIQANPSNDPENPAAVNRVAISNSWGYGAMHGVMVDEKGRVAVGNIDDLGGRSLKDRLYVGATESMVFHDGGNKALLFNAEYTEGDPWFRYISNYSQRTSSPAAGLMLDYVWNYLQLWIATPGTAGSLISDTQGITMNTSGYVGINVGRYTDPRSALEVNGDITLTNGQSYGSAQISMSDGAIWAKDGASNQTVISPHFDPRQIDPKAQTSFGDISVKLPFSFYHKNPYIGKGEVVDMAKVVKYIEGKMKAELGEAAGQVIFSYDLPPAERKAEADYEVELVMDELRRMGPIKVEVGEDGKLPEKAMVSVDEMRTETRMVELEEKQLDLGAGRIVKVKRQIKRNVQAPTGRKIRQLAKGWSFERGALYRKPTLEDLNVDQILQRHPKLPQWVVERMRSGSPSAQSVSELMEEIKKRLAEAETMKPSVVAQEQ